MFSSSTIIIFLSFGLGFFFVCTTTTTTAALQDQFAEEDLFDVNSTCIVNVTKPNCTKCAEASYAPYPGDPTMFYQCDNGELSPMHCPNNTEWNQTLHICVHEVTTTTNSHDSHTKPMNWTSTSPTPSNSTSTPSNTTSIPSSTTLIPSNPTTHTSPSSSTTVATQEFDGASFGGGIAAGIGIALIVLLLIRCCCYTTNREGYEQHI